ncbi:hypothetical protein PanWU01x14_364810 [Parasponia andersonii]|uniref:Uncharacterized protein n=1 Tax=Parasponia andersonii TaxID=3476 RepID=A0A2P5A660_PARAD|nr:hypothetical protein PanWU01x14_364810 [Parasponia andersonii]
MKEFRIAHKLFLHSVVNGRRSIKELKRNRISDYEVSFDLGGAKWLMVAAESALRDEGKAGVRTSTVKQDHTLAVVIYRGSIEKIWGDIKEEQKIT